jgi:hypothetical protein
MATRLSAHESTEAQALFAEAIAALNEDPSPLNVARYLRASEALDQARPVPLRRRRSKAA